MTAARDLMRRVRPPHKNLGQMQTDDASELSDIHGEHSENAETDEDKLRVLERRLSSSLLTL